MISIIIPLHNLGKNGDYCLKKCLDSIIAQTYTDFEVLLMENGSTDDTVAVAEEYVNKDSRFKLHILTEKGIANARNEGLDRAAGEYVCFIDGDDYISFDFLENLYNAFILDKNIGLSILPCYLDYVKNNKKKILPLDYTTRILDKGHKIEVFNNGTVWAKLYSKDILDRYNIRFDTNLFGVDDNLFISEYRLCIDKISITNKGSYFYVQGRKGQTTLNKMQQMVDSCILLNQKLYNIYEKHNAQNKYKSFLDYELIKLFIGKDFASAAIIKMPKSYINNAINLFMDRLVNITPDPVYCPEWQIKWFNRFLFFAKKGYGALFLKFMRKYRNFILQPLGIKYKAKQIK